jgi:DNA-binding CsgD family transcriptional regulator
VGNADASCAPPPERLQFVYNLSAAEAAFTCRVLRGDGVSAASAALGISENTGKTHLKAVFEKVGVTRQAELVRRVIADVGGLCDGGGHGPDGVAAAGPRD